MSQRYVSRARLHRIMQLCHGVGILALLLANSAPALALAPRAAAGIAPAPASPAIAATLSDAVQADSDANGRASAGDTLRYTAIVSNTGSADATNLAFDSTLDPNTALVAGSVRISALAFPDSYSALQNTPLTVPAPGLLANDTGTGPLSAVAAASAPTTAGGSVHIAADGSFTYTPPATYSGPDSFAYTASNSLGSDSATVSITAEGAPQVASTTPANAATGIPANSTISISFSEPVTATAGTFAIDCAGAAPFTLVSTAPATSYTLDPTSDLPATATCTVTVTAALVSDVDALDPPDTMAADYVFSFTSTDAAPTVVSTTPANTATQAAANIPITIDFSESVSATPSSFALSCGGTGQSFTLSASPASSYTLTPNASLPGGATCTVTVVGAQIHDVDAIDPPDSMAANYVFTFATDAAPTVTSTSPISGTNGVATDAALTITFSESVSAAASSFALSCGGTGQSFALSPSPASSYILTPTTDLPANTRCVATVVAAQVHDSDTADPPDSMAADYVFAFTTDAAPTVTSTSPISGTNGVATDAALTITFSESVSAAASAFALSCGGTGQSFTLSASPASSYTLTPNASLPVNTLCTATVVGVQIHDSDTADPPDSMAADYVFAFTTDAAPTVTSTSPISGTNGVAINATLTITFSESVSAAASSFALSCGGTGQSFTLSASPASVYTLTPSASLPEGASCTATVVGAQIHDSDTADPPDSMAADYVFAFTTDAAPTVVSAAPASGALDVALDATLTITFSESVSAAASSFALSCGGTGQSFALSASPASVYTLTPSASLPVNTLCTATVVAAQVHDSDMADPPDSMAANYVFAFTTVNDNVPTVTGTSPANGATAVALGATLAITFSESVSATTSSFALSCGGTGQSFTLSASPASSYILTPTTDLPANTSCVATVVAAQIHDVDAIDPPDSMAANYVFSFSIETDAAPSVASTSPISGTNGVAASAAITVTFDEPVTVGASAFVLACPAGTPIALTNTTGSGPAASFVLAPSSTLPEGTICAVTVVAAQVHDVDAIDPPDSMAADYVFAFTTDAAPTVTSTSPISGTNGVATDAALTITFSESVSAAASAFALSCGGTGQSFTLSASPASVYTLTPSASLPEGANCTATVVGAQIHDSDTADPPDSMAADYVFAFTTDAAPTVTSTSPISGTNGVAINATLTITFSESVSATTSSFALSCGGTGQSFTLSASPASSYTLTPSASLPEGASCTATVVGAQIHDSDTADPPDSMAADYVFAFTTDAAPTVTSTSPISGTTSVTFTTNIVVNFSESVSATASAFALSCGGTGQSVTLSASPATSYTLNPASNLPPGSICTLTVVGAQIHDSDTADPPDTMAADYVASFAVAPDAVNDSQSAIGNTLLETGVAASGVPALKRAGSLIANDISASALAVTAGTVASAQGGSAAINADGSFSYTPPAGYTGADSFGYTVTDANGSTGAATVHITVAGMIWYVNNTASGGDGRSPSPFSTLAAAQTASAINDSIYVHRGNGTSSGQNAGITLKNGQQLIGENVALIVGADTLNPGSSAPTIGNSGGAGITLAQNNTVRGLNVGTTSGAAISGSGFGALALDTVAITTGSAALSLSTGTANASFSAVTSSGGASNVSLAGVDGTLSLSGGALSGASGHAFVVSGGTAAISYAGTISNSAADAVNIQNKTGGTAAFSGAISSTGTGIALLNNTGAAISFSGGLALSTGGSEAFTATGGGTVSATQNNTSIVNTITTTSGTALNVANTSIGASDLTFRSITSGAGAGSGILLSSTGSSGGLIVTGNGSAGTGGTIQHKTGTNGSSAGVGIYLNSTRDVSLSWMQLNDFDNFGIYGTNVTNFTLANTTVSGTNGNDTPSREGSVIFDNLLGAGSISGVTISGGIEDNLRVENSSGTLSALAITNCTVQNNSTVSGNMGIFVASKTTANVTATIQNCTLRGNRTIGIRGDAADSSTLNITITGNTIAGGTGGSNQGNQGIEVSGASNATATFDVENNLVGTLDGSTATPLISTGINIFNGTAGTAAMSGKVIGNTVLNDPTAASGVSNGFGIRVFNSNLAAMRAKISSNVVKFVNTDYGILAEASGTTSAPGGTQGRLDVEVSGNNVDVSDANALDAIRLQARNFSTICARVPGNSTDSGGTGFFGLFARQANSATLSIEGLAGGAQTAGAAQSFLAGQNPSATTVGTFAATSFTGVAANSCNIPTLLAAGGEGPGAPARSALTPAQLDAAAKAARALWQAQGSLSVDERARLGRARFELGNLSAGVLGQLDGATVHIDRDAAGWGWFADSAPGSDAAFAAGSVRAERRAGAGSMAYGRMDLLTVVMHELGHLLGRDDLAAAAHPSELMTEALPTGARRALANSPAASVSATIGTLPAGKRVVIVYDAAIAKPLPQATTQLASQGTVAGSNFSSVLTDDPATAAAPDATITFLGSMAYLPMALHRLPPPGLPDLVIERLDVTRAGVQLTVRNQGQAPVTTAFWVDVYINPSAPPTHVNQIWPMLAQQGLTWGVTGGALPIAPGGTLTLSIGDAYYQPALSIFSGALAPGTAVYGQVDSANTLTNYGAVLESHEQAGAPYNNISGPALPAAAAALPALMPRNARPAAEGLPARPAAPGH